MVRFDEVQYLDGWSFSLTANTSQQVKSALLRFSYIPQTSMTSLNALNRYIKIKSFLMEINFHDLKQFLTMKNRFTQFLYFPGINELYKWAVGVSWWTAVCILLFTRKKWWLQGVHEGSSMFVNFLSILLSVFNNGEHTFATAEQQPCASLVFSRNK